MRIIMHPRAELTHGVGMQSFDFEVIDAARGQVQLELDDGEVFEACAAGD
jgi:hypothetical protein